MNTQPNHEDDIFKEKRKPKNPIKFKIQLNEEQKEAKAKILDNTITLLAGAAGSGKTLLACQIGLEKLFMRDVEKVIITRPTVSKEEIGFLPGDLREKMDPWVQPIYQNMFLLYDKTKIEELIKEDKIESVKEEKQAELKFDIPDPESDLPVSQMTIRDLAAILLKKPVSNKKWLNKLIE